MEMKNYKEHCREVREQWLSPDEISLIEEIQWKTMEAGCQQNEIRGVTVLRSPKLVRNM